jgi:hypothetical protein
MGCYSRPPLKEISSRDLRKEGRNRRKRWRVPWCQKRGWNIETLEKRKSSRCLMPLFVLCVGDIAHFRIGLCFMTLHVFFLITQSSWSSNLTGCLEWKRTFSNSNVKDDTPIGVRTSRLNWSSTRSKMIFSWTIEQDGYMKNMAQKWTTLSWVLDRPWQFMSAIRAPGRVQESTHEATMIWLNDRREPRSTLGWKWMVCR